MTNTQLLLSIGIPSLLVVLAWLSNSSRLAGHDKRFDDLDSRFSDVICSNHRDALEIMRSMAGLHERVAVVETKQGLN